MQKLSLALLCILSGINLLGMDVLKRDDKELLGRGSINQHNSILIYSIPGCNKRVEIIFGSSDIARDKTVKNPLLQGETIKTITIPPVFYNERCGIYVARFSILTNTNREIFFEKSLNATIYKDRMPHYTRSPDTKKLTPTQISQNENDYKEFAQWLEVAEGYFYNKK